jgi:diguanylate cyclase (GGDEF)-like protein
MAINEAAVRDRLSRASRLLDCAAATCDALVEHGYELPSLYLERAGRLRCYGARGYWHVLDGLPPGRWRDVARLRDRDPAADRPPGVQRFPRCRDAHRRRDQRPIVIEGRCAGVLNLESRTPLDEDALTDASLVASAFADRAAQLGGIEVRRGWMLLADHTAAITDHHDPAEVVRMALDLAVRLSGAHSALLATGNEADGFRIERVVGPLYDQLAGLAPASLCEISRWVDGPLSCYTIGEPSSAGFTGQDTLHATGVQTLVVVALSARGSRRGFLLVADQAELVPTHEVLEQLEVLASLVAGALMTADHVRQLVELSRRDPLTGLGHSRAFTDRLRSLSAPDRRHAVYSIDVDHFKDVNDTAGHEAGDQLLRKLAERMSTALRETDSLYRTGGDEFAAVVAVDGEDQALAIGERLRDAAIEVGAPVSVGVAVGSPGMSDHCELFSVADAALLQAKRSGRNAVVMAPTRH